MAGVKFEIVHLDGGGSSGGPSSSSAPSPSGAGGGSSGGNQGPQKPQKEQGPKPDDSLLKGLRTFADMAGLGPYISAVEKLTGAVLNFGRGVGSAAGGGFNPPANRIPGLPSPSGPAARGPSAASAAAGPLAAAVGPAVVAVTAFAAAVAAAGYAVYRSVEALHEEGKRLQGYSPELSAAYANSSIRAEMADMRRAQRLGPDVARVENVRSRVNEKMADVVTELYALLAKFIVKAEPAIILGGNSLELLAAEIELMSARLETLSDFVSMNGARDAWENAAKTSLAMVHVKNAMNKLLDLNSPPLDVNDPFMDAFLEIVPGGFDAIRERDARRPPKAAPPAMPLGAAAGAARLGAAGPMAGAAAGFGVGGFF